MTRADSAARVYIVEDHDVFRETLQEFIQRADGFAVCGCSESAESAVDSIDEARVDVALIDVSLPGMSGLQLVEILRRRSPKIRCVMLSGHRSRFYIETAVAAGAKAYVPKEELHELIAVLRVVLDGKSWFPAS